MSATESTKNNVLARIRKIAALAARGVGGEQQTARAMLEALLREHDLTIEQVIGGEKRWVTFDFRDALEEKVLVHFVCNVMQVRDFSVKQWRGHFSVEMDAAKAIVAEAKWPIVQKAWRKEYKAARARIASAFISAQRLFGPPRPDTEPENEPTAEELAEFEAIANLARAMQRVNLRDMIPATT